MKQLNLNAEYKPMALLLQIEHTNGKLGEVSMVTHAQVGGHGFRHDIWWQDMPQEIRERAQELIDCAIDLLLREEAIHQIT